MLIARIEGATRNLGAPAGWDRDKDGRCLGLPIRDDESDGGLPLMTSAWTPTPEELARLNAGASIHLTIVGRAHPPVAVEVGQSPGEDQ